MTERADDQLTTADMAAAAVPGTLESDRAQTTRGRTEDADDRTVAPRDDDRVASREAMAPLFSNEESSQLRSRWEQIQTAFVDEPREAVQHADELVAQVMRRLAEVFAEERGQLEHQWTRGDDVSTEDLRIALRRYRSFFDRLLSI